MGMYTLGNEDTSKTLGQQRQSMFGNGASSGGEWSGGMLRAQLGSIQKSNEMDKMPKFKREELYNKNNRGNNNGVKPAVPYDPSTSLHARLNAAGENNPTRSVFDTSQYQQAPGQYGYIPGAGTSIAKPATMGNTLNFSQNKLDGLTGINKNEIMSVGNAPIYTQFENGTTVDPTNNMGQDSSLFTPRTSDNDYAFNKNSFLGTEKYPSPIDGSRFNSVQAAKNVGNWAGNQF